MDRNRLKAGQRAGRELADLWSELGRGSTWNFSGIFRVVPGYSGFIPVNSGFVPAFSGLIPGYSSFVPGSFRIPCKWLIFNRSLIFSSILAVFFYFILNSAIAAMLWDFLMNSGEDVRERGGEAGASRSRTGKMECQRSVEYRAPVRFALTGGKFIASDAASFRTAGKSMGKLRWNVNEI
jgi:hypothetical protein